MTLILFLIILGALIFVHELGHFLSAKAAGIRVDEFALGFPPKVISKKVGETLYSLNLVPFGGFVKIFGEDGAAESIPSSAGEVSAERDGTRQFTSRSKWVQALVLCSGVLGNIAFAWLLISAAFISGVPSSVEGRYADNVQNRTVTVTDVLQNSPAERAGLRTGDKIVGLTEGARVFSEADAEQTRQFIAASGGRPISISYRRGAAINTTAVVPEEGIVAGKPAIGVSLEEVGIVRFGFFRSILEGLRTTADLTREVAAGLFRFATEVFRGRADLNAVSGPIGIAGLVGEARVLGFVYLLSFTAFISINLAVINLMPLPALDGGRLLFLLIEALFRRPIPPKVAKFLNTAGFMLLIALMLFISYRDVVKLFGV